MSRWDDYSEKEWDEPGEDFGCMIYTNRRTGEVIFESPRERDERWGR